jgi:hypothetical protein
LRHAVGAGTRDLRVSNRADRVRDPAGPVHRPAGGRWNSFEVTAAGDTFTMVLTGQTTVDRVRHAQFANGGIAMRHGNGVTGPGGAVHDTGVVRFRKVEIIA